jgi:hypothetical protein
MKGHFARLFFEIIKKRQLDFKLLALVLCFIL